MKYTLKCALIALSVCFAVPSHATIYSLFVTGTIAPSSINNAGLFGGGDLVGKTLTISESFDSSLITFLGQSNATLYAYNVPFTVTASVNGSKPLSLFAFGHSHLTLSNGASTGDNMNSLDSIKAIQVGNLLDGSYLSVDYYVQSFYGFVPNLDFDQTLIHVTSSKDNLADGGLRIISNTGNETNLRFSPISTTIALNPNPNPVPEPDSFGMILLGLGLLGFMQYRKDWHLWFTRSASRVFPRLTG